MQQKIPALAAFILALSLLVQPSLAQERRPARIGGKPNLNGIWQAANEAYWNLEGHSAESLTQFADKMGAVAAIPAGNSVVVGGTIPYKPEALAKRAENRAGWPASDPEAKCYMAGIPRATYMPYPFQIVQGEGDIITFAYTYANANRPVFMRDHQRAPVDLWMGRSNGSWDGDTLVIEVNSNIEDTWLDRAGNHHSSAMVVTERYTLVDEHMLQYEATIEDPETFTRPWTIRMPLYRRVEPNMQLGDFKCEEFVGDLVYGKYQKK